jgi:hypothetical protein
MPPSHLRREIEQGSQARLTLLGFSTASSSCPVPAELSALAAIGGEDEIAFIPGIGESADLRYHQIGALDAPNPEGTLNAYLRAASGRGAKPIENSGARVGLLAVSCVLIEKMQLLLRGGRLEGWVSVRVFKCG